MFSKKTVICTKNVIMIIIFILLPFYIGKNNSTIVYASNELFTLYTHVDEKKNLLNTAQNSDVENEVSRDESIVENEKKATPHAEVNIINDIAIPIIIEFFGAFLGVISAIWLSKKDERKKKRELDSALLCELRAIFTDLQDYLGNGNIEFYRYDTTIWDINLASGAFNELDYSTYAKYVVIYSKIKYAQEIEREWSHAVTISNPSEITSKFIESANNERKRLANEIIESINDLINKE